MKSISEIRKDYQKGSLNFQETPELPIGFFKQWLDAAIESKVEEPTAFTLSTTDDHGDPVSRVVLLKEVTENGLVFFTNYSSQKGKNIDANHNVYLNFFWPELERQVRIKGIAEKLENEENDKYFYSRPITSQAGAIVSHQSQIIEESEDLQKAVDKLISEPERIIRPNNWGGFLITPSYFEFWQGRPSRIHDRLAYSKLGTRWKKSRLSP